MDIVNETGVDSLGSSDMGQHLYACWVNLKRVYNGLEAFPAGAAGVTVLWGRLGEDGRAAWNALWVGLVQHGYEERR